jgi:hypothetical protein
MKKNAAFILLLAVLLMVAGACYDDTGNYHYNEVEDPIVKGLVDQTFVGYIGDSLIIEPNIQHSLAGTESLSYEWNIYNHLDLKGEYYYGPSLRMLFNLKPETYTTKLTITNHTNGMKYFYKFKIEARTEFTRGTAILSNDGGTARLSFIKQDNSLRPNIYEGVHGGNLPKDPRQILIVDHMWLKAYHILTGEVNKPGVILDAATMLRVKPLEDNFFDAPPSIKGGSLALNPSGVSTGIFNGKLYCGQWQTCPCSPIFGIYGAAAVGDYELSPWFNFYGSHYLGYDMLKKRFVQFDINTLYKAADYQVIPMGPGFDPKNMNIDLLYLKNINSQTTYAFGKDAGGNIQEYKFMDVPNLFFPQYQRTFAGANLVRADTKWQASTAEIFYFTSDDKIYRYNPTNQEVRALDATFPGKSICMIKLVEDGLLLAGTEGQLHYLDVSTGKNGNVLKTVEKIPGSPVDVVIRK